MTDAAHTDRVADGVPHRDGTPAATLAEEDQGYGSLEPPADGSLVQGDDEATILGEGRSPKSRQGRSPQSPAPRLEARVTSRDPSPSEGSRLLLAVTMAVDRMALELEHLKKTIAHASDSASQRRQKHRRRVARRGTELNEVD